MTRVSLSEWLDDGSVKRHSPTQAEVARLLAVADRDLADASVRGLSADRAFSTAYESALQLATIVVRASGYRASSSTAGHHWRTIALLVELMGPGQQDRARFLDSCRRSRNQADYDRVGVVSAADVAELLEEVLALRADVLEWLERSHPTLG